MRIDPEPPAEEEDEEKLSTSPTSAASSQRTDFTAGLPDDPTRRDGLARSRTALQEARLRLYEEMILGSVAPQLAVGKLSKPDAYGWRWLQCTNSLQVLLPPDAANRYDIFLKIEKTLALQGASSDPQYRKLHTARQELITLCMTSKPDHPVRGITPSFKRYALQPGFRCESIDAFVGRDDSSLEALSIGAADTRLVPRSDLGSLGKPDDRGRRWLRLTDEIQVLLPADVAYQYQIFLDSVVSTEIRLSGIIQDHELALANFVGESLGAATYIGRFDEDGLFVLDRDSASPVISALDPTVKARDNQLAEEALEYARDAPSNPSISEDDSPRSSTRVRVSYDAQRLSVLSEKDEDEDEEDEDEEDSEVDDVCSHSSTENSRNSLHMQKCSSQELGNGRKWGKRRLKAKACFVKLTCQVFKVVFCWPGFQM